MNRLVRLTDDDFESVVLGDSRTHVVLFSSDGCASCAQQHELLLSLRQFPEFGGLTFHSVDRFDAPYFFSEYVPNGSIPSTCVFRSGQLLGSYLGYDLRRTCTKAFLLQHLGDHHV